MAGRNVKIEVNRKSRLKNLFHSGRGRMRERLKLEIPGVSE